MKKFFLVFIFAFWIFLFLSQHVHSASPQCDTARGRCDYSCGLNEKDPYGSLDCETTFPRKTCCIQVTPGPSLSPGAVANPLDMMNTIPGLTCGVPYNPQAIAPAELKNRACNFQDFNCYGFIPEDLANDIVNNGSKIPVVGGIVSGLMSHCIAAQTKVNEYQSNLRSPCIYGEVQNLNGNLICVAGTTIMDNKLTHRLVRMCDDYERSSSDFQTCNECALKGKYYSALGCISLDLKSFISETLLGLGVSLGGLFALLCIIYSAFRMQTSQGNPEAIKKAQETMTSCILGLILIIFSIFILRFIGVNILKIPFIQ